MGNHRKLIFLLFYLLSCSLNNCQNIIVEYQFKTLLSTGREFLVCNTEDAFYFDYVEGDNLPIDEILNNYNIDRGGQKIYKTLNNINSLKLIKAFPKTKQNNLIEDNKYIIDWKVSNHKQNILGFACRKAVGKFRGRIYTVWFTSQIPISLGPWKLDGLPGLILKVEEKDGVNGYEAVQIIQQSTSGIPKSVYSFLNNYDKANIILYQDYINRENEHFKLIQQQSLAHMPKGITNYTIPYFRSAMREFNFEWDNFEPKNP